MELFETGAGGYEVIPVLPGILLVFFQSLSYKKLLFKTESVLWMILINLDMILSCGNRKLNYLTKWDQESINVKKYCICFGVIYEHTC